MTFRGYIKVMISVKVRELKNRLSHYLQIARKGETVVVLDRNTPIAEIRARSVGASSEQTDRYIRELSSQGLLIAAKADTVPNFTSLIRKARAARPDGDWRATLDDQRADRFA